jgi:hypothetical protein
LSTFFTHPRGNGKIHRYPLAGKKLKCIGAEVFKKIKVIIKGYGKHASRIMPKPASAESTVINNTNCMVSSGRGYEATNIWTTRESQYWRWRRVREWFREYGYLYSLKG